MHKHCIFEIRALSFCDEIEPSRLWRLLDTLRYAQGFGRMQSEHLKGTRRNDEIGLIRHLTKLLRMGPLSLSMAIVSIIL